MKINFNYINKKIWLVTILMLVVALVSIPYLPSEIPSKFNGEGDVMNTANRLIILIFPIISIAIIVIGNIVATVDPKARAYEKSRREYNLITSITIISLLLISNYSLGMKQKIYVIAALLCGASNIMLDEPFNCLDPEMSRVLKDQISIAIKEGKTILYSTHNLDTVSRFCDEVMILGKTHEIYPISNMEDADMLEKIFFEKCIW